VQQRGREAGVLGVAAELDDGRAQLGPCGALDVSVGFGGRNGGADQMIGLGQRRRGLVV
jgi:hypothetical protein